MDGAMNPEGKREDTLYTLFQALREEEQESAPELDALLAGDPAASRAPSTGSRRASRVPTLLPWPAPPSWKRSLALALPTAAVVTLAFFGMRAREINQFERALTQASEQVALGSWKAPSDFLLELPGQRLYQEVPMVAIPGNEGMQTLPWDRRNQEVRRP